LPQFHYLHERDLSAAALDLIRFDADSIHQVVSAERRGEPDVWLLDPDRYEHNGRVLRDSESPRMLAYSTKDKILYSSDGCNACGRPVSAPANVLEYLASLLR
jgi:hypothetical protein